MGIPIKNVVSYHVFDDFREIWAMLFGPAHFSGHGARHCWLRHGAAGGAPFRAGGPGGLYGG